MRLHRKGRKKDVIIFGDGKAARVLSMEPNPHTGIPDIYIKQSSPEIAIVFIIAVALAGGGYTFFGMQGALVGLLGGFFLPLTLFAFFVPSIKPTVLRIPETAIAGLKSAHSLKAGTRYLYCPTYDSKGNPISIVDSPISDVIFENERLGNMLGKAVDHINSLEWELGRGKKTRREVVSEIAKEIKDVREAAVPRTYTQKKTGIDVSELLRPRDEESE